MKKEQLKEYPKWNIGRAWDYEADLELRRVGTKYIKEHQLNSGEKVVILYQAAKKLTEGGTYKIFDDIVIAGYVREPRGLFKSLRSKKVGLIPESETEAVKSELLEIVEKEGIKPKEVLFWRLKD